MRRIELTKQNNNIENTEETAAVLPEESVKKNAGHFISNKESKAITKRNFRLTRAFEKRKKTRVSEENYLTEMKNPGNIVEFDNLHTYFFTDSGISKAVNGVSFEIPEGAIVGVVGESGCGKSVTAMSLMQLVQAPQGQVVSGSIRYKSVRKDEETGAVTEKVYDIAKMPTAKMNLIRGSEITMIFQEPMTSMNPIFTIGAQLDEVSFTHIKGMTKEQAKQNSISMLELVGIAMPEHVYKSYPHELSGGMRQRVMIAMSLICNPRLIIADEPTTALDVTIQAQILELLREVKDKISGSIMLITHDLGVIAEMADYVVVMYAGRVIERGTIKEIFKNPCHPYTVGLQRSKPVLNQDAERLFSIPGQVPNPIEMPKTCFFRDRCNKKQLCSDACTGEYPPMVRISDTHSVACYLYLEGYVNLDGQPVKEKKPRSKKKAAGVKA